MAADSLDSTQWSIVLAAGQRGSARSEDALATLCQTYWFPVYAYVRRRVAHEHEAQDLTQDFFANLLEKNFLAAAQPQRGRFRSFLLTAVKHFLANQWQKAKAQKRGGDRVKLSLDFRDGETRYRLEPADEFSPERLYLRQWALTLTKRALTLLEQEYEETGKGNLFAALAPLLTGASDETSYQQAATQLHMSSGSLRVAVHRMRRRYGQLLRREIAQTVNQPSEIEEEIQTLFWALGSA